MRSWREWAELEGAGIRASGRWRQPRSIDALGPEGTLDDGTKVVAFASNDYLGLTGHPAVRRAAVEAVERWGTGSGSARLIVGSRPVHDELERELAAWKGEEAAVLFPTGFMANLGVVTTFGGAGVTILSDELNHASIIDGTRLARAEARVYRHADADHVEALLGEVDGPAVVVTDSVFSMDGDLAPVGRLAELCSRHGALLVLDEAHEILEPAQPTGDAEVVRVGTLSKTLGSLGGFVATSGPLAELLVNRARSFIFTTASSPADAAAALAAVRVVRSREGAALVARLRANVDRVRPGHPSPVVPVVVGGEEATLQVADALRARGVLVPAVRPPTVPPGTSRLRVAISAAHTAGQLDSLVEGLDACLPGWRG
ncbi:MAG: aminotransferase class I/II-fold pyridoxal phosphate-dependent enzyme [Acidimicrobiia bacterium]